MRFLPHFHRNNSLVLLVFLALALITTPFEALAVTTCTPSACTTATDTLPLFSANPTIIAVQSGPWSDSATWSTGALPAPTDRMSIPPGVTVTLDTLTAVAKVVGIAGTLTIRGDVNTGIALETLQILPGGVLEMTHTNPAITTTITFVDTPIDLVGDPEQYSHGMLVLDGTVRMTGSPKIPYVRLAQEPHAGAIILLVSTAVAGWRPGDRLYLPDTQRYAIGQSAPYLYQGEFVTLASVDSAGTTLTLSTPLVYDHLGAVNAQGVLEFLPHVANTTRSLVFQSVNNGAGTRGHIWFSQAASIVLSNALSMNLGRTTTAPIDNTTFASGAVTHIGTNQEGRYPWHTHHLHGPLTPLPNGFQFAIEGNVVLDDFVGGIYKWSLTIHDSHFGLIKNNVVIHGAGWGIGTEAGNETGNLFDGNFVAGTRGTGGRENPQVGVAYFLRGPNNILQNNIAVNTMGNVSSTGQCADGYCGWAYKFLFLYLGNIKVPNFPGADTAVVGQYTVKDGNTLPLAGVTHNESYGVSGQHLGVWWLGMRDTNTLPNIPPSLIDYFTAWGISAKGLYNYQTQNLTFDHFTARCPSQFLSNSNIGTLGMYHGDYIEVNEQIHHADIQGCQTGIFVSPFRVGTMTIDNSFLANDIDISVTTPGSPGSAPNGTAMRARSLLIQNVQHGAVAFALARPRTVVNLVYTLQNNSANLIVGDTVHVQDMNNISGNSFQVYYTQQATTFVVPQSSGNLVGAPVAGLTNMQAWATYGIAIGGVVAPCTDTTTHADIAGFTCSATVSPNPPSTLTATPQ